MNYNEKLQQLQEKLSQKRSLESKLKELQSQRKDLDGRVHVFTQCISFDSSFRLPKNGCGAWNANKEYTWSRWLAHSEGGTWKLMTWGY